MIKEFEVTVTKEMVDDFAYLSGDYHEIHFGRKAIVHGMLIGALFSHLIGMYYKGLYLSQSLEFRKPIKPGMRIKISGEIIHRSNALKVLKIKTTASYKKQVYVDGMALIKLL